MHSQCVNPEETMPISVRTDTPAPCPFKTKTWAARTALVPRVPGATCSAPGLSNAARLSITANSAGEWQKG